ncbi:MAG: hypothetical protein COW85_10560 [Ignavibacteria bacterium CG22_combo_CG10-13_8_21_14_all_37_15]|nr:hypothetical protein [Ignavibacteria bacterium]OIO23032.1 MAG: hypothetical protein AUJ54_02525 [Ignavibacteria bacterium CG1_02_37_35]PIP77131.1 MAG: hypothetical protein COW85_10560 [Ignavibacteria bacterium CG22_combo_CG10-13_8_21_14_all_37_15]PIS44225.1 MAG: hypothetical protein COT22_11685 [Ignavibacteria bacterium CG08_land_8_20_14_0_20_37_9]PIX92791.1 MAG: hypothetical protein COZ25_14030 [Ignavibacteria bacterium CG_4_10_14_3_um_filter_37_18]PJC58116.1 MAG: hypothetical protein CO02
MKQLLVLFSVLSLSFYFGCGGNTSLPKTDQAEIPGWYLTPPQDPNYLFAVNSATSQDMQMAVDKAMTGARAEIGRQMELKLSDMQKKFAEEVGQNDNATLLSQMTQATKTVVSTNLTGSTLKDKKISKDGNTWRAYVLMQYPLGSANQALVDQIKKNNELYTRFRSSQSFEELDKEVQKIEDAKKAK